MDVGGGGSRRGVFSLELDTVHKATTMHKVIVLAPFKEGHGGVPPLAAGVQTPPLGTLDFDFWQMCPKMVFWVDKNFLTICTRTL